MTTDALAVLQEAGLTKGLEDLMLVVHGPYDALQLEDAQGRVEVRQGKKTGHVGLPPLSSLFRGNAVPPSFQGPPPPAYMPLFLCIERSVAQAAALRPQPERDEEFERLYRQVRRRPDGKDPSPLFRVIQAAARLALCARPTSRAEFEAVMDRLSRSARTFHTHTGSTNYFDHALAPLVQGP